MMITFDEAFSWINKFEDRDSNLSDFNRRIVSQLEIAHRKGDTTKVKQYLNLLSDTATKLPHGYPEKSEIYLIIAKYEVLLKDYARAADLIMEAKYNTYPLDGHDMGVAEWLLGCVLFRIPEKQASAISAWQRSKDIFQSLSDTADVEKGNWYHQVIEKMENAVLDSIGQVEIPVETDKSGKAAISSNDFGVMRIPISDTIPAQALSEMVSLVDEIYGGHLKLSRAESGAGNEPFPDSYELREDETLYIPRLEIGTPNFMEFFGQAENLIAVLSVVGTAIGLGTATINIIKSAIEIKNKKMDTVLKQLSILQKEQEIKQKQEEESKTAQAKPSSYFLITDEINIRDSTPNFETKAKELAELEKISSSSLDQYIQLQEDIQSRIHVFHIYISGEPTFTLISFDDGQDE